MLLIVLLTVIMMLWSKPGVSHTVALAQSGDGWSAPVMVSTTTLKSWFPDIAVDGQGHAYIVWHSETREEQGVLDLLMYTAWDGASYSEPNDVVFPGVGGWTVRPVIAVDDHGILHMAYRDEVVICYSQAPADAAWSAASWMPCRQVSGAGAGSAYYDDVAVDEQGAIHVVWSESVAAGVDERWLWFGTPQGAALHDGRRWRSQEAGAELGEREIYAMIEDDAGMQWFGTDEGAYRFDGVTWRTFTTADGLAGQRVSCLAQDEDGRLWFGTDRGVSRYDESERRDDKWKVYTVDAGLPDNAVHAIAMDPLRNVWVGTEGGLARYDGEDWVSYGPQDGLVGVRVLAVAADAQADIWVGTEEGVNRYDGEQWLAYTVADGLLSNVVTAIAADRGGAVWFGTDQGVSRFDGREWTSYTAADGLVDGAVTALMVDSEGTVWVGTEAGVSRYAGRVWETFDLPQGSAGQSITAMAEDQQVNAMCPMCSDIFYRRSGDGGQTWSAPVNLSQSFAGSSKPQVRVGRGDGVYVTWEEGEDWIAHVGYPVGSGYAHSPDGGNTWTAPTVLTSPLGAPQQITLGVGREGDLVVVWRLPVEDEEVPSPYYYQTSVDNGVTWSEPEPIPGVIAKPWERLSLDGYDAATDSAGNVHLLVLGYLYSLEEDLGVMHLVWNGSEWSSPTRIYASSDPPEWPKLDVGAGNQVHATWFTRDEEHIFDSERGLYKVWASSLQADAPSQVSTPLPTSSHDPASATPESALPSATATPTPVVLPDSSGLPPGLDTESDELGHLIVALSPIAVILLVLAILRWGRLRH